MDYMDNRPASPPLRHNERVVRWRGRLSRAPLKHLTQKAYHFFYDFLPDPPRTKAPIKVVCIADTEGAEIPLPRGDILIHAGDMSHGGSRDEIQAQFNWMSSLSHDRKFVIAGNRDKWLDVANRAKAGFTSKEPVLQAGSVEYLEDDATPVDILANHSTDPEGYGNFVRRKLVVHGGAGVPLCGDIEFAFQYPRNEDLWKEMTFQDEELRKFNTSILVTHVPPKYHVDSRWPNLHFGCESLLKELWRVRPTLHVCGHVHDARGKTVLRWDKGQRAYERACSRTITIWDGGVERVTDMGFWRELQEREAWMDLFVVIAVGIWKNARLTYWPSITASFIQYSGALYFAWYQITHKTASLIDWWIIENSKDRNTFSRLCITIVGCFIVSFWTLLMKFGRSCKKHGIADLIDFFADEAGDTNPTIVVNAATQYDNLGNPEPPIVVEI